MTSRKFSVCMLASVLAMSGSLSACSSGGTMADMTSEPATVPNTDSLPAATMTASLSVSDVTPTDSSPMIIQSETQENGIRHITVFSSEIDDTFVIDILTPDDYDSMKTYPVVYITDGNWRRDHYPDIRALSSDGRIVDNIFVSICYPDSYDIDAIRDRDLIDDPESFLKFIVDGLIPYVAANYSTDPANQTLCGASCGGYFTLYSLLRSNGLTKGVFQTYIFASPTLTESSYGKTLFDLEEELFAQTQTLDVDVYMTVGGLEEEDMYLTPIQEFEEQLLSRNYEGLDFTSRTYDGLDHYAVWIPSLLDGLMMFLAPGS